jgi:hypothetical protein
LARKGAGKEAKLSYSGHVLMENRNGLAVDAVVDLATGTAERDAAFAMAGQIPGDRRVTVGGDKNYDTADLVEKWRGLNVTPHVAQNNKRRRSAIDQRTTRHSGYLISQQKRKRVEEIFGWLKTVGGMRRIAGMGCRPVASEAMQGHVEAFIPERVKFTYRPTDDDLQLPDSRLRRCRLFLAGRLLSDLHQES